MLQNLARSNDLARRRVTFCILPPSNRYGRCDQSSSYPNGDSVTVKISLPSGLETPVAIDQEGELLDLSVHRAKVEQRCMSITSQLQGAARSVYRRLFRAANDTFRGDDVVLNAFLDKIRNEYRAGRSISDAKVYEEKIKLGDEVASFLRQNIVQGEKTIKDVWRLNITPQTELGNNDTIRKSCSKDAEGTDSMKSPSNRINFSELKRLRKGRELPVMDENDLKESFVRGSGPGGQSINKTENCVQLVHLPTGIRVSCQETRSLELNRRIARKLLLEKLDQRQNPGLSKNDFQRARMKERERQKKKKRRKKEKENSSQLLQGQFDETSS